MRIGVLSIVYSLIALLSVLLLISYFFFDKKQNKQFVMLFCCVAASNCGYFLLSICNSLSVARLANGMSYFGGAFSVLMMLLIIYNVCRMRRRKA